VNCEQEARQETDVIRYSSIPLARSCICCRLLFFRFHQIARQSKNPLLLVQLTTGNNNVFSSASTRIGGLTLLTSKRNFWYADDSNTVVDDRIGIPIE
jgi:hypothetical protein